ncbi:hypothetical protein [Dyadobacter sandarakinus]|uniref:hypothetical protein n=1 Tax=Dyadobacter sandarakinus TaxID=2747268 RepID=UPI0019561793|nr:hypothetical protein [Dyadobacter sandarakinus]
MEQKETIAQEAKRLLALLDPRQLTSLFITMYPDLSQCNFVYGYLRAATDSLNIEHVIKDRSTLSDVLEGNCYSSYPQKSPQLRFSQLLDDLIKAGY